MTTSTGVEDIISIANLSHYQVSRTIFVVRGDRRPRFLNTGNLRRCQWPTAAMRVYESVVKTNLAKFYWTVLDLRQRKRLVSYIAQELYLNGNRRVYKRIHGSADLLKQVTASDFERIITKRFKNLQNKWSDNDVMDEHYFSPYTPGETVMVESRSSLLFEGKFVFDSVINNSLCYVKFDSRNNPIPWQKDLLNEVDLREASSKRRITRQMTRSKRQAISTAPANLHELEAAAIREENGSEVLPILQPAEVQDVIELSDDDTILEDSSVEDSTPATNHVDDNIRRPTERRVDSDARQPDVGGNSNEDQFRLDSAVSEDSSLDGSVRDSHSNGQGVARSREGQRHPFFDDDSSSSDEEDEAQEDRQAPPNMVPRRNIGIISTSMDYETLLRTFGDGSENYRKLDLSWLERQGQAKNPEEDYRCPGCQDLIPVGGVVYNVKCYDTLRHPMCKKCMKSFIEAGVNTLCPYCKFDWATISV